MLKTLQENLNNLNNLINECEEIQGRWNGDESGYLEDQAGLYADIQNRLEESREDLLQAIVLLIQDESE